MRLSLYAAIAVALCSPGSIQAQSNAMLTLAVVNAPPALPDAPSAVLFSANRSDAQSSSSQQQPQTTTPPQQTTPPANETPEQRKARIKAEAQVQVDKEEHQRTLGVLPAFNTVIAGVSPPLTPGQKWNLVYHTAKDPYTFAIAFVITGIGEAEGNTTYGWGPDGYFKDVGASYLDNVDGALIGNAILPIILHQDPRYFRLGHGPVVKRIIAAALSTVICRGDNGKKQFNTSNVAGNFISGAISNAYYPADKRGLGLTFDNALVVTAEGAFGAQLLEFGPDLNAYLSRRHARNLAKKNTTAAPTPAQVP